MQRHQHNESTNSGSISLIVVDTLDLRETFCHKPHFVLERTIRLATCVELVKLAIAADDSILSSLTQVVLQTLKYESTRVS